MTDREPDSAKKILDRLADFLWEEREGETADDICDQLREDGIDPNRLQDRVGKLFERISEDRRLQWSDTESPSANLLDSTRLGSTSSPASSNSDGKCYRYPPYFKNGKRPGVMLDDPACGEFVPDPITMKGDDNDENR